MTIVKLYRRALLPVLGLALLILPAQSPAAPGLGRVDITPDHVAAGSTNTFTLTFNADTGPLQGQTLIDILTAMDQVVDAADAARSLVSNGITIVI